MNKLKRELSRALANNDFEQSKNGIVFPKSKLALGGVFTMAVNGQDEQSFNNTIVNQFRTSALEQLFGATAKIGTYYIAPYAGNVTPAASWTAANFTSSATEFTNYDEAARQEWDVGAVSAFGISNVASRATFTIGGAAQTTIWGAALLSSSAKSATSGVLVAAARASAARENLVDGDEITLSYTIVLNDAS